jgi:hypothetical protein
MPKLFLIIYYGFKPFFDKLSKVNEIHTTPTDRFDLFI